MTDGCVDVNLEVNKYFDYVYDSRAKYFVLYGGAGAGKSVVAAQKVILRLLTERNHRGLCIRKFAITLEDSVIQLLRDVISAMGLDEYFHYSKTRPRAIICKRTNSQVLFKGIDDPEKLKSLSGITFVWIEEASELLERDFIQLDLRLRGETEFYKQIMLTFNPVNVENYTYRLFFGPEAGQYAPKTDVFRATYMDNRFIDNDYKEKLNALKDTDPHYYKVYCLAEWGTTEEIIYRPFRQETFDKIPGAETWYGLDFGYTAPTALVQVQMKDNVIYVRELMYKTRMTNYEIKQELKSLGVSNGHPIYADPGAGGATAIATLRDSDSILGYQVIAAKKEVSQGINTVQELHNNIVVHTSSVNLVKEANVYQWRRGTRGELLEEPVKHNDHLMDAMRYAIHSHKMHSSTIKWIKR